MDNMDGKIITRNLELIPFKSYRWKPKEDITAYELARALDVLLVAASTGGGRAVSMIPNLPDEVRRHFEEA
jgi:hypothetical protein